MTAKTLPLWRLIQREGFWELHRGDSVAPYATMTDDRDARLAVFILNAIQDTIL